MAASLGLTSVAEGVETDEQYRVLAGLGCDLAQGFGIAKPMVANEVLAWNAKRMPMPPLAAAAQQQPPALVV